MTEWKLVPVEPDAAMVRAGQHALMDRDYSGAVFKAMLAASPPAPSAEPVNLNDPAVQKRLAAQWGYVPAPSAEPVAWQPALSYPGDEKQRVWANGKPRPQDVEYWTKNGNGVTYAYASPPDHTAAMQQALEALEERYVGALRDNAIDALRAALERKR